MSAGHSVNTRTGRFSVAPLNLTLLPRLFSFNHRFPTPRTARSLFPPQSCNEFKEAFNRPACLDLHSGQLSKSWQLTPNQLPHGWWVSRKGTCTKNSRNGAKYEAALAAAQHFAARCQLSRTCSAKPKILTASALSSS